MFDHLEPSDIAANVMMLSSTHPGSFLVVEGSSDSRLFDRLVDRVRCMIIPAHGRNNVIGSVGILDQCGIHRVLGIIDSDYDVIKGLNTPHPDICRTDTHDLETMIVRSPAFNLFVSSCMSHSKIAHLRMQCGKELTTIVLECACPVGLLRFLKHRFGLEFDDLDFEVFVDPIHFSSDRRRLISHLKSRSPKCKHNPEAIEAGLRELESKKLDSWHICRGHDIADVLVIMIRKGFGSKNSYNATRGRIEEDLRSSYTAEHFAETDLYRSMKRWEHDRRVVVLAKFRSARADA